MGVLIKHIVYLNIRWERLICRSEHNSSLPHKKTVTFLSKLDVRICVINGIWTMYASCTHMCRKFDCVNSTFHFREIQRKRVHLRIRQHSVRMCEWEYVYDMTVFTATLLVFRYAAETHQSKAFHEYWLQSSIWDTCASLRSNDFELCDLHLNMTCGHVVGFDFYLVTTRPTRTDMHYTSTDEIRRQLPKGTRIRGKPVSILNCG